MAKKKNRIPPTIENRKARHDYLIEDTIEVGIKLTGSEVKSVRNGQVSLGEGYVRVQESPPELWLHSVNIAVYAPAAAHQHKTTRTRQLLAHKREILKLYREVSQKGVSLVPLKMYFKNGYAKVLVGVGTGRGKADKRQALAEREAKREIDRAMSRRM